MSVDVAESSDRRAGTFFLTRLLSRSAVLMTAKIVAATLGFLTYWLLAQALAPEAFGAFLTALSLAAVAGSIATFGYPSMTARFDKRYETLKLRTARALLVRTARRHALMASVVVTGLAIITALAISLDEAPVLIIMAGIIPAIALLRINGALAIANGKPFLGYLPDMLGRPFVFIAVLLVIVAGHDFLPSAVPAQTVAWISLIAAWIVCGFQTVAIAPLRKDIRRAASDTLPAHHVRRLRKIWLTSALPLVPSMLIVALFPDLVLIAAATALSAGDLAVLGVCLKIAFLIGFIVQVTVQIALPEMARCVTKRDMGSLWTQVRYLAFFNTCCIVAATAVMTAFSDTILGLFGSHYVAGASLIVWLCVLQLVRLPASIAIQILILAGRARDILVIMAATLAMLIFASVVLGQIAGLTGIVTAIGASFLVMSALSVCFVRTATAGPASIV